MKKNVARAFSNAISNLGRHVARIWLGFVNQLKRFRSFLLREWDALKTLAKETPKIKILAGVIAFCGAFFDVLGFFSPAIAPNMVSNEGTIGIVAQNSDVIMTNSNLTFYTSENMYVSEASHKAIVSEELSDNDTYKNGLKHYEEKEYSLAEANLARLLDEYLFLSSAFNEDKAILLNLIGCTYTGLGLYEKAIDSYDHALVYNSDPEIAFTIKMNMSFAYAFIGRYDRAEALYAELVGMIEAGIPTFDETINIYLGSVLVFRNIDDSNKVLDYLGKAQKMLELMYGSENIRTSYAYNNIGTLLCDRGEYEEGLDFLTRAVAIREKESGTKSIDTAAAYHSIVHAYTGMGNFSTALEYCLLAKNVRENLLSDTHPYTADTYNNLGILYGKLGKFDESILWHQKALDIRIGSLGKNHMLTAQSHMNIAYAYLDNLDFINSATHSSSAQMIYLGEYGKHSELTAEAYITLAVANYCIGNIDMAIQDATTAYEISLEVSGPFDEKTAEIDELLSIMKASYNGEPGYMENIEQLDVYNNI